MTPTASSKAARSETPGTHASGASNLTEFLAEPPRREVRVPTPIKKPTGKASAESSEGFGFCAAGQLCGMPYLALELRFFGPSGESMHNCTECEGITYSGLCATYW
jgi:hypothetical protein